MRRRLLLTIALGTAAAVGFSLALVAHRRADARHALPLPRSAVSLVGDSLNLGVEAPLQQALPGWDFHADDVVGRSTATGIERLRSAGASLAPYVVVSLGTNDPASSVAAFRRDVREALRIAGPRRCVIWSTIHRDGNAYDAFNQALAAVDGRRWNLRLVDWERMIAAHPEWLAADGVHGSPDGYSARAASIVDAMRLCHDFGVGR